MHAFVTSKDEDTLKIITSVVVWMKNPFVSVQKKVGGPTVQLESVLQSEEEEEDEEDIPVLRQTSVRK